MLPRTLWQGKSVAQRERWSERLGAGSEELTRFLVPLSPLPLPPQTGITSSQCFTYYTSFPSDRRVYKWTVGGLLVLDLFHTAISRCVPFLLGSYASLIVTSYTVYYWGVTSFGDLSVLGKSPRSFTIESVRLSLLPGRDAHSYTRPFMTGVAAAVVQIFCSCFYLRRSSADLSPADAYRVYVVGGRKLWVPLLILLCSAVQFGKFAHRRTTKQRANSAPTFQASQWAPPLRSSFSARSLLASRPGRTGVIHRFHCSNILAYHNSLQ